jgi:hypothetical protein
MPEPVPPYISVEIADATTVEFKTVITPVITFPVPKARPLPIPEPIVDEEET